MAIQIEEAETGDGECKQKRGGPKFRSNEEAKTKQVVGDQLRRKNGRGERERERASDTL